MRKDVRKALNVCGNSGAKAFDGCAAGCIGLTNFDSGDTFDYTAALGRALTKGILVTMFYGMQDTACDYVGGHAVVSRLKWPGAERFRSMPVSDLVISNVSTGSYKSSGGLSWVQVQGAGHMVPLDNPAAAMFAINTLIFGAPTGSNSDDMPLRGMNTEGISAKWLRPEPDLPAAWPSQMHSILPALVVWVTASLILVVSGQWAFRYQTRQGSHHRLNDDTEL